MNKYSEMIKKAVLFFSCVFMTFSLFANNKQPDSLFFESFNLRYQNPDLGIIKAKEMQRKDPTNAYAYLSMSFNYFYKSDYDNAMHYIDTAIKQAPDNAIIKNMKLSLDGWINQRLGKYFEAYQSFNKANDFYSRQINKWLYSNNLLFWQAYAINSLGNITFQFYYFKDFKKINSLIFDNAISQVYERENELIPDYLNSHIYYLVLLNYITNLESITDTIGFEDHFKKYLGFIEDNNYYQQGNFYEVLGLIYPENKELVESLLYNNKKNILCNEAIQCLIANSPELCFFEKALECFKKHGDVYQISGQYYHIGAYYRSQITNKVNLRLEPEPFWLSSLDSCINRSLYYQYIRDTAFFKKLREDSPYFDKMKDSIMNKLVSLHWCMKSLQLRHFHDGIKKGSVVGQYNLRPDTHNMKLLAQLQKKETENIGKFFYQVEDTLLQKIRSDRNRNFIIIGALFLLIMALLVIAHYRRKRRRDQIEKDDAIEKSEKAKQILELTKIHNEAWNNILYELSSIWGQLFADKVEFDSISFDKLNQGLLQYFKSEYSAIGIFKDGILYDKAFGFSHKLEEDKQQQIKQRAELSSENTIIGKFLNTGDSYQKYTDIEIFGIQNEHLEIYRQCMESGKIDNIHLAGIYGQPETEEEKIALGYISLINVSDNNTKFEEDLNILSAQLEGIIEGEFNRQWLRAQGKDENFINALVTDEANIEQILKMSFKYFGEEFRAGIVSFRVPVINGSDDNPENNLKLALRFIYTDPNLKYSSEIENYYKSDEKKTLSLKDVTYKTELLCGFPEGILIDKIGQSNEFYDTLHLNEVFSNKTNIILPIRKLNHPVKEQNGINEQWRNLCGIINIQPYNFNNRPDIVTRMKSIAKKITYLLNHKFNESKNEQISALHNQLNKLDYEQVDTFYNQINELVKIVINADICSIFIYNKPRKRLELKATTADKVLYDMEVLTTSEIQYLDDVYYSMADSESITWRTYLEEKTHMFYNIKHYPKKSSKFIEFPKNGNLEDSYGLSRLFVPLMNTDGSKKCFGVIKCLGARFGKDYLIHSFWDFDRETVEFISALAAQLIEYAILIQEKDTFIKQMVHETTTPIAEMLHNQIEYYNRITREKRTPPGFEKYHNNLVNNILLQKQILIDLESISSKKSNLSMINPSKENTRQLLLDNIRLFEESAFFEKGITFVAGINNLPDLFIDRSRLQQVFINLIRNAVQYSYPKSQIKILYEHVDKYIDGFKNLIWHEIKFQNDGIGIPESEVDDIFLLYRRGSNAHKSRPSGSGIGLYLVDQIVRAHGGICKVVKLNNPTEIAIFLPSK